MNTLLVVNGEAYWQEHFPGIEVHTCRLQTSRWLYEEGKLWVFQSSGALRVEAVLWRVGAIRPHPNHRAILEMIRLAGVPCLNRPAVLLRGYDRLSMLNEMREAGLPVIPYSIAVGERLLEKIQPPFPVVLKAGNYHAGFGKVKVDAPDAWAEISDFAFITEDYITLEPFVDYVQDVRCLAIGSQMWAMARRSSGWRANTGAIEHQLMEVPPLLEQYTRTAMAHLDADILGLDFLQRRDGSYLLLESNDVPGLSGFPEDAITALAAQMRAKIEAANR